MKECPICKESFPDDLNFCDLDGSPLYGGAGNTVAGSSSKLWSFLGIGLLLAAVGITAGAIIFFPRGPSATLPSSRSQSGGGVAGPTQPGTAPDNSRAQADASGLDQSATKSSAGDVTASTSPDQARLASRKAALSKNDNSDPSLPNPKTVAGADDDLSRAARQPAEETRPRSSNPSTAVESGSGARAVSTDSSGSESAAKSPTASAAAAKHRPKTQSQADDTTQSGSKKDDKKKGGFLRVFKKIFGHG